VNVIMNEAVDDKQLGV